MKKYLLLILILFFVSGCGKDTQSVQMMVTPSLQTYHASDADVAYLKTELEKLLVKMSDKDVQGVTRAYSTMAVLITHIEDLNSAGNLTLAEATSLWKVLKAQYQVLKEAFDFYEAKMDTPLKLVYQSTKRTAAIGASSLDTILKLAESDEFDIDMGSLTELVTGTGKSFLPLLMGLL